MDTIEKGKWIDTPRKFKQYIELLKRLIFTRGQFWPPGIVVACVCPSVRPSVRH